MKTRSKQQSQNMQKLYLPVFMLAFSYLPPFTPLSFSLCVCAVLDAQSFCPPSVFPLISALSQ